MSKCPAQGGLRTSRRPATKRCLVAVLMVSVMAVSCFVLLNDHTDESDAAYDNSVWVNGREVSSGETERFTIMGLTAKATYDGETGTLTLDNFRYMYGTHQFEVANDDGYYANIYSNGDLNIIFTGSFNGVSSGYTIDIAPQSDLEGVSSSYGIYVKGKLTITSEISSPNVTGISISSGIAGTRSFGIYAGSTVELNNISQKLTLNGGATNYGSDVELKSSFMNAGLCTSSLAINNCADVNASAGNFIAPSCSGGGQVATYGILAKHGVTITNSNVTAKSGDIDSTRYVCVYPIDSAGIYSDSKVTINDSGMHTVTAASGDVYYDRGYDGQVLHGGANSWGIYGGSMVQNGGTVSATGGVVYLPVILTRGHSYGVYLGDGFVGNSGTLTATGSDAALESAGMYIYHGNFTGEINATFIGGFVASTSNSSYSFGLKVDGDISLNNSSRVEGIGGTICYRMYSAGVEAKNIVLSDSSKLIGRGGDVYDRYTTTTKYKDIPFVVSTGSSSDSYGVATWGSVTVNTYSALYCYGGSVTETPSGGGFRISSGLRFMGNGVDGVNSIAGDGTANVYAIGGNNPYGHGIYEELDESIGISTRGTSLRINGAMVTANGGDVVTEEGDAWGLTYYYAQGSRSTGIFVKDLILENHATVNATGGPNIHYPIPGTNKDYVACHNDSFGLYLNGSLTVTDSVLNATAGGSLRVIGILIEGGGITVNGDSSEVTAIVPDCGNSGSMKDWQGIGRGSWGIYLHNFNYSSLNIVMNSGKLDAEGYTKGIMSDTGTNTISAQYVLYGDLHGINMRGMGNTVQFSSLGSYSKHVSTNYTTYTLSFKPNGGSGTMDSIEAEILQSLPACGFTAPAGKHFIGWSEVENGGLIHPRYNNYYVGKDMALYAIWEDHETVHVDAVEPTCTERGNLEYWYCENCGGRFSDAAGTTPIEVNRPALEHDFEETYDWADDGLSCTIHLVCKRDPRHSFVFTAEEVFSYVTKQPTCTEKGCTQYYISETHEGWYCASTKDVYDIPALGHTPGRHTEAKPHTCVLNGNIEYWNCSVCGKYFSDAECTREITVDQTVDPPQHSPVRHEAHAATCSSFGNTEYWECSVCHFYFADEACTSQIGLESTVIPKTDHTPVTDAAVAATCNATGLTEGSHCSVCGTVIIAQNETEALGHVWGEWTVTEQPTCTAEGTETHYCTRDHNHSESRAVEMIDHALVPHAAKAATCTEDGNEAYWECSVCHRLFLDDEGANQTTLQDVTVAATGHTPVTTATLEPTCTEAGHTGGTHCSVCDAVLTAPTPTSALGHQWGDWIVTVPATEDYDGSEHRVCSVCSEEEIRTIPALGHTHVPNAVAEVPSTCAVAGHSAYWECTACHRYFADEGCTMEIELGDTVLELAPHTHVTIPGVAATCTSTGLTDGIKCSVCDLVIEERQVIPMTDHNLEHHSATAPTCTENGNNEYWQCSDCHGYFSDANGNTSITESATVRPATGHTPVTDDYVAPTCTSVGHTEGSHCSVCGTVIVAQEEIQMLAHTKVHHAATAPTCTAAGNIEYWECTVCHNLYGDEACTQIIAEEQTVLAALGHNLQHHDAVAATCTAAGMEAYDSCSRCDYESEHSAIPSLGHSYSATYSWSDDGSSCVVHIVCANDGAHNADINAEVSSIVKTEATTSSMGVTEYSVSGTHDGYAYSGVKEIRNIPALEPEITQVSGTSTYTNTVTENQATKVTEIFSTAKDNSGSVEVSVPTTAAGSMTIAFDNAAVNSIAAGDNVTLEATVKQNAPEVADAALVIEVKLSGATFSDGKAKVTVPFSQTVPEGKILKVYFINGAQRQDMNATLVDGNVVFETNHFSTYAVIFEDEPSSDDGNDGGFPVWIIAVVAVVVVAAVGGVFFFMQQKKNA